MSGCSRTALWSVLGAGLLLAGCSSPQTEVAPDSPPAQLAPRPAEPAPLEVTDQEEMGERSMRFFVESDLIAADQITDGRLSVVVTLPVDYDPQLDYPVLYLLHGTDSSATSWFEEAGVEQAAAGLDAIVVQPEGGETGWYSDWSAAGDDSRYWRTHHLEQVVPWVDGRYGTVAGPKGRAILGASAGGFGAMSYAQQRPDLFGTVVSLSGVLSLQDPGIRGIARDGFARATGNGDEVLGDGRETTERQWQDADPALHTGRLQDTAVAVYRGSSERYESQLGATTDEFLEHAEQGGIEVESFRYEDLFDEDDQMPNGSYCTGGHEWSCWSGALHHAAPWLQEEMGEPR